MIRRPPRSTLFPYTNALPIWRRGRRGRSGRWRVVRGATARRAIRDGDVEGDVVAVAVRVGDGDREAVDPAEARRRDRKSTRLNSSHANISYAVFCLKKKQHHH